MKIFKQIQNFFLKISEYYLFDLVISGILFSFILLTFTDQPYYISFLTGVGLYYLYDNVIKEVKS